jgi:hypothetical protein
MTRQVNTNGVKSAFFPFPLGKTSHFKEGFIPLFVELLLKTYSLKNTVQNEVLQDGTTLA